MAFRSLAILSVLVSAVLAQSNPYIPPGISNGCSTYLTTLNNDATFASCTTPFTNTLQQFAPGANSSTITTATIKNTLTTLCESNSFSACPESTIRAQLGSFYAACSAELTSSPNQAVKTTYDVLYALVPLRDALCSKDDSGNFCATELSSNATGQVALADPVQAEKQQLLSQYLYTSPASNVARRDVSNTTTALAPNTTTYQNTNLLFMFLQPSMSSTSLCTTCTRNIITPYITFESNCPYAPGLSNSLLLLGQTDLYNNITSKCGSSFLSGAVAAAGGLSSGILSNAASHTVSQDLSIGVSAVLGVAAFVAASL